MMHNFARVKNYGQNGKALNKISHPFLGHVTTGYLNLLNIKILRLLLVFKILPYLLTLRLFFSNLSLFDSLSLFNSP